ncbi:MAG TPA: tyrosine--tRNA ligase [Dehalococcoidia bacterium]|nr:tyrosine--tRNA ligase [Dehalococcoidia bacterium]
MNKPRTMAPVSDQLTILMDGVDLGSATLQNAMESELIALLEEDRPLTVYCGYDPTATDLHLGHIPTMVKLRQFQNFGHRVIFLIGSFTAQVGDPTGKQSTRPMLDEEAVQAFSQSYIDQAFIILDAEKTEVLYNHEWLAPLNFADVIKLAAEFSVGHFLQHSTFRDRIQKGDSIRLSEFMYAILQAYDALHMKTDIQIGGSDQIFNIVDVGRTLQTSRGQKPQVALTLPILVGTDGREKMSKSLGNTIGLQDAPNDMFGKVMSLPDQALDQYARLVTNLHPTEVNTLLKNIEEKKISPIEAKKKVAAEVVKLIYSFDEAIAAEKYFETTFQKKQEPIDDAPEYVLSEDKRLISVIMESMNYSGGEARRIVNQGAVKINDQKAQDINFILSDGDFIKIGRHTFFRIREN